MFAELKDMDRFRVITPSVLLAPYVKQYWFVRMENVVQSAQRLVPFGCVALSFHRGNRAYSSRTGGYMPLSHLYGIATDYTDLTFSGYVDFVCIVFQPVGAQAFFGTPVSELNNSFISLDELNDRALCTLGEQLVDNMHDDENCVKIIEQFLSHRIYQLDKYEDKRMDTVIAAIRNGKTDIEKLAETACLGYKQFKRVFTRHIGANPKDFLRIVRFGKLHHLLQQHTAMTVTQLASECSYYDKSHLIKELKTLSGFTPDTLHRACDPVYSGYHALFRSAFVDLPA